MPVEEETFETGDMLGTEGVTETETGSNEEGSSGEEEGQDENQGERNNEGEPAGPNPVLVLNADVIETKKRSSTKLE